MKILCIGDIVGDKGVDKAVQFIEESKSQFDFIIANIENSNQKSSRGFSEYAFNRLTVAGVSVFTGGNHSFDNKYTYHLYHNKNLLRPCNFPEGTMGQGSCMTQINDGSECSILVINVQLRVFMREMLDCPFRAVDKILSQYKNTSPIVL